MCNLIKNQVQRLKVVTLILICVVCSFNALSAQEFTIESPTTGSLRVQKTIIRNLSETHDIVYKTDGSTHLFCLVDSTTTIEARMPFTGEEINDFEILDSQYVFFCGNDGAGYGFIGYFDLIDVFSSSTLIVDYQSITTTFDGGNYTITNFKKLEVFSEPGNYVHVVLVGDCYCENGNHNNYCVADMYETSVLSAGIWKFYMTAYDKNIERFDDIAFSKYHVVTAGVLTGLGNYNSIRFFDKPTSVTTNIFSTSLYQTIYYSRYSPLYPISIEHCEQDYFVTASVFDEGHGPQTILTSYNGMSLNSQYYIKSDPNTPISRVKDMGYHPKNKNLYFVQDFRTVSSTESLVFNLDPTYVSLGTANFVVPSSIDILNSLDANAYSSDKAQSSGVESTGESMIYHRDVSSATNPCSSVGNYYLNTVTYPLEPYDVDYEPYFISVKFNPIPINITTYTNNTECEE